MVTNPLKTTLIKPNLNDSPQVTLRIILKITANKKSPGNKNPVGPKNEKIIPNIMNEPIILNQGLYESSFLDFFFGINIFIFSYY